MTKHRRLSGPIKICKRNGFCLLFRCNLHTNNLKGWIERSHPPDVITRTDLSTWWDFNSSIPYSAPRIFIHGKIRIISIRDLSLVAPISWRYGEHLVDTSVYCMQWLYPLAWLCVSLQTAETIVSVMAPGPSVKTRLCKQYLIIFRGTLHRCKYFIDNIRIHDDFIFYCLIRKVSQTLSNWFLIWYFGVYGIWISSMLGLSLS